MPDREKVIKGLESLHTRLLDMAMQDSIVMLDVSMVANAIALLKEQGEKIAIMRMVYGSDVNVVGEIVRCKDCKYWSAERINDFNKCRRWINVGVKNFATLGDWFCADGKRKEGR